MVLMPAEISINFSGTALRCVLCGYFDSKEEEFTCIVKWLPYKTAALYEFITDN